MKKEWTEEETYRALKQSSQKWNEVDLKEGRIAMGMKERAVFESREEEYEQLAKKIASLIAGSKAKYTDVRPILNAVEKYLTVSIE